MPRDKNDADGAKAIAAIGFPSALPVLDDIIRWLRIVNAPVVDVFSDLLAQSPEFCTSTVGHVLGMGACDSTKYVLVSRVVPRWPREHLAKITWALQTLLTHTAFHDTDLRCIDLLEQHSLSKRDWLAKWTEFKVRRLRTHLSLALTLTERLAGPDRDQR